MKTSQRITWTFILVLAVIIIVPVVASFIIKESNVSTYDGAFELGRIGKIVFASLKSYEVVGIIGLGIGVGVETYKDVKNGLSIKNILKRNQNKLILMGILVIVFFITNAFYIEITRISVRI